MRLPAVLIFARRLWTDIVWFARIVWACRIALASGLGGIVLFCVAVPAQNLMADLSFAGSRRLDVLYWFSVFALTGLMWALPIHYAARRTLATDTWIGGRSLRRLLPGGVADIARPVRDRYGELIELMPLILGALPFLALAIGIIGAAWAVREAWLLPAGSGTLVQCVCLLGADIAACVAFVSIVYRSRASIRNDAIRPLRIKLIVGAAYLATTGFFVLAYFAPIFISFWVPRALLVPPLLGSLVLSASWLQRKAHRFGVPLVELVAIAAIGVTALNAPFHAVRTIAPVAGDGRYTVADALVAWKKANACTDACPRPLLIAIDGGASRAAFAGATFIGEILDRMPPPVAGEAATPGRRIFAISGVSGGALGAVTTQAAIADTQTLPGMDPAHPPCRTAHRTWFRYAARTWSQDQFTWRDCLQALTSGDYLTPTFVGLGFRDFIAPRLFIFGGPSIEDRAVLLEQAWERHYDYTLSPDPGSFDTGHICGVTGTGLCRPMAHPRDILVDHPERWMPLLLLNGTSVRTGRRIVSSDLASSVETEVFHGALYDEAYDLREAMSSPCPGPLPDPVLLGTTYVHDVTSDATADGDDVRTIQHGVCVTAGPMDGPDLRLSTAALTSARFPLISPAGSFSMKGTGFGDRLVDGGYFENSGISTAIDVVNALRSLDPKLAPILVSIGNDPESDKTIAGLPQRRATTPLLPTSDAGFWARVFGPVAAPVDTVLATRDGHANEAMHKAEAVFARGGFYRLRVAAAPVLVSDGTDDPTCRDLWGRAFTMTTVSMSWWLSASVQADLDAQRCSTDNRSVLAEVVGLLRRP